MLSFTQEEHSDHASELAQERVELLSTALSDLITHKRRLLASIHEMPTELEFGDCYRTVLDSEEDFDVLLREIGKDILRLSKPGAEVWNHTNPVSGLRSNH